MSTMPYRWWIDPFTMFNEMRSQLQRQRGFESRNYAGVFPAVNIYDDGDAFMIRAELPGIDKDKLDIEIKGNRVSIRGERTCEFDKQSIAFHRKERDMGSFHRVVSMPEQVDSSKATASYNNGILEIICPRAEIAKSRRVQIA